MNWPSYASNQGYDIQTLNNQQVQSKKKIRCVTLVRDPLSRLRSLYTYARSGGEHWFRFESKIMAKLADKNATLAESLDTYWNLFGKEYLEQSHAYTKYNLNLGCTGVKMENFHENFNASISMILGVYGVRTQVHEEIISSLGKTADSSRMSKSQRNANPHLTSIKFSSKLLRDMTEYLMQKEEIRDMIEKHRLELGYT